MQYLPLFHQLKAHQVIVLGDSAELQRKVELLQQAGADVVWVAQQRPQSPLVETVQYQHDTAALSLAAVRLLVTDDLHYADYAAQIQTWQQQYPQLLLHCAHRADLSDVIFPSIIDRDPVLVAVTSSGQAPLVARWLRTKLEAFIPQHLGRLTRLMQQFRAPLKHKVANVSARRSFWESQLEGHLAELVYAGREQEAEQFLQRKLKGEIALDAGEVYLVGAGPGDPELLTLKALRLMQKADVVVYDRLVSKPVLDLTRRDAEMIHVGKRRSQHTMQQEDINQLLADLALQGKRVLRLKGGDPFIFGRGGEEIETLMDAGVPFQVVPGITAASGCASYSGIPLTHRDHAQSVSFITGHLKEGGSDIHWPALVHPNQTLVFYMGLVALPKICEQLMAHGLDANTPLALVQQGTTPNQKVITATVATIVQRLEQIEVVPPTLVIIGGVVTLHEKLQWFNPDQG